MEDIKIRWKGKEKWENRFREYVYWESYKSYEKYLEKFIFKKGRRIYEGMFLILCFNDGLILD